MPAKPLTYRPPETRENRLSKHPERFERLRLHKMCCRERVFTKMKSKSRDGRHKTPWVWPVLLVGIPLYLYVNLFAFRNIPFHLDGDQTFFWAYALRMLHGDLIYRDFFQFTPPGTDLFFLALFKLFGPRIWVMNSAVLLLGAALCGICFSIAKRLMDRDMAMLATLFFLVFVYSRLLDATHHWFSLLALLCAVRVVMPEWTGLRSAIAGTLLGVASFFTQTAGVAGLIALLLSLAWERLGAKKSWRGIIGYQLMLLAAFGLTVGALDAYLITKIGWRQLWYFLVVYPRHYVEFGRQNLFPGFHAALTWRTLPDLTRRLFVYVLLLILYPSVLWHCWRERSQAAPRNVMQLSLLGLMLLLEVITRTNWVRIYAVSAPALILLAWVIARRFKPRRYVLAAGWAIVACLAVVQTWSRHHDGRRMIELPAGKTVLSTQKYEKFSWLMQHTKPGDFFYQALWVNVYPPLELRSPVFLDVLISDEDTRPEFVALSLRQLERAQVKYILWSPMLNGPLDPGRPWEYHLGPLRAYLLNHYARVQVFSDQDEVWQRD